MADDGVKAFIIELRERGHVIEIGAMLDSKKIRESAYPIIVGMSTAFGRTIRGVETMIYDRAKHVDDIALEECIGELTRRIGDRYRKNIAQSMNVSEGEVALMHLTIEEIAVDGRRVFDPRDMEVASLRLTYAATFCRAETSLAMAYSLRGATVVHCEEQTVAWTKIIHDAIETYAKKTDDQYFVVVAERGVSDVAMIDRETMRYDDTFTWGGAELLVRGIEHAMARTHTRSGCVCVSGVEIKAEERFMIVDKESVIKKACITIRGRELQCGALVMAIIKNPITEAIQKMCARQLRWQQNLEMHS